MTSLEMQTQNVTLPLQDYNQLYEKAFFTEKNAVLEKERHALEETKKHQEKVFKQRLEESLARREKEQRVAITSNNWLLIGHSAEGCYESGVVLQDHATAVFNFELDLRVFDPEWTVIPMVDSQMITDNWKVQRVTTDQIPSDGLKPVWAPVSLGSDTALLVQELDGMPSRRALATNIPGLYHVSFTAYVFVHTARNLQSLSVSLVHPITAALFTLKHEPTARTLVRELNITPASRYSLEEKDGCLSIAMCLPPTKTFEVKWRRVESSDVEWEQLPDGVIEKVEEEPLQITVTHDALHSIMDGVLQSSHTLKFCVDSEQRALNTARFTVHGPARVTGVTGYGVVSWRAFPVSLENGHAEAATCVEVAFKSSLISDNVIILLNTELELDTDAFTIPSVICEGVLRQTGSLAVVKMTNVEVHEHDSKGMAHVSVDELSAELKSQTNQPIMFAYKYLSPHSKADLRVVKHGQIDVLEAVAESAIYEVLMSDGQSMHRLMLNMQNSRQQYLEVQGIPPDARLWSLLVNSKPAKPVQGKDGKLLIPLLVGLSGNSNEGAQSASIELTYLIQRDPLADGGLVNLAPPSLNIPISKLLVEVQWPKMHHVKFTGSMQRVHTFSHALPQPVNHDVGTAIVAAGFDFNRAPAYIPKAGVNVQVPRAGEKYRFEQLLVVDGGATLIAEYTLKTKEEPQQRFVVSPFAVSVAATVLAVATATLLKRALSK